MPQIPNTQPCVRTTRQAGLLTDKGMGCPTITEQVPSCIDYEAGLESALGAPSDSLGDLAVTL